ncbi:hypothetical protein LCGC14_0485420, partial [marine sediment metagenome]
RTPGIDKELVRKELTTSPIYEELLTSAGGRTTALQVNLKRDERHQQLLGRRESLREQAGLAPLSAIDQQELVLVEQEYREYSAAVNDRRSALVDTVRQVIEKYRADAQVYLGGVPMIAADMINFVKSDLVVFGFSIILFIIFRKRVNFLRYSISSISIFGKS